MPSHFLRHTKKSTISSVSNSFHSSAPGHISFFPPWAWWELPKSIISLLPLWALITSFLIAGGEEWVGALHFSFILTFSSYLFTCCFHLMPCRLVLKQRWQRTRSWNVFHSPAYGCPSWSCSECRQHRSCAQMPPMASLPGIYSGI